MNSRGVVVIVEVWWTGGLSFWPLFVKTSAVLPTVLCIVNTRYRYLGTYLQVNWFTSDAENLVGLGLVFEVNSRVGLVLYFSKHKY